MKTLAHITAAIAGLPEDRRFRLLALFHVRALWTREMGVAFAMSVLALLVGSVLEEALPSVGGLIEAGARVISVSAIGTAVILGALKELLAYGPQKTPG